MLKTWKKLIIYFCPLSIVCISFLFFYISSFPGFMSPDSFDQYHQAQMGIFSDWHAPIMAWVWFLLNKFFQGPQGMLFFHLFLFWGAIFLFYLRFKNSKWSWLFFVLGFLPWIANFEGVLWKDMGLAFSLLAAIALFLMKPQKMIYAILAISLLLYAFMVRHNAIIAIAPFLFFLTMYYRPNWKIFSIALFTSVLLFGCIFINHWFSYSFLKAKVSHPFSYVMDDDLVHISLQVGQSLLPGVSQDVIKKCGITLTGCRWCLLQDRDYQQISYAREKQAWLQAIKKYPLEYLHYRIRVYLDFIRNPSQEPYEIKLFLVGENDMGIVKKSSRFTYLIERVTDKTAIKFPFLFKPYFWLLFSAILCVLSFFIEGERKIILLLRALMFSSLLYILGYIPVTEAADFRYIYWSIIAINFGLVIYFVSHSKLQLLHQYQKN